MTARVKVVGLSNSAPDSWTLNRRRFCTGLAVLGGFRPAYADGAHAAFTVIEHNARAGTIEVIHRLMALDLEIALIARTGRTIRLEEEADLDGLIAAYLDDYFSISTVDGDAIPLTWVGAKLSYDAVLAYQEAPMIDDMTGLSVANQMLTETHPSQINTVNVTFGGRTRTRLFTLGDAPQTIDLT